MLVSHALTNLIGGVSQQPPSIRVDNAHEEVINTWPSVVSGLQKRPPTKSIARVSDALMTGIAKQVYNDPISGQTFFILASDNDIKVYNQLGVEKTVNGSLAGAYLDFAGDPKKNCRMLTVGDTTFLMNRMIVTETATVTESSSRVDPAGRWTIFVSEAIPNAYYTIYVNGVLSATMLSKNNLDASHACETTSVIAESLRAQLAAVGYTVTRYNSTLALEVDVGLEVEVYNDGHAGKALKVFSTSVESFSELPPQEELGRILEVTGDPSDDGDDYYVQFSPGSRWVETYGYDEGLTIVGSTMPHKLVYDQGTDEFTFSAHSWGGRLTGDAITSPAPSYLGLSINSMLIYRGRMGFLSDENFVFSEAGNFENSWRTTVVQLLDDDPIDLSVVSGRVSVLNHAIPFNKRLVLFADQAQYILDATEILSPKTAVAAFTTGFQNSVGQSPVNIGPYVYFIDDSGTYLRMLEYYSDNNAQSENADDTSVQVPEYMLGPISGFEGSSRLNAAIVQGSSLSTLYTYRFVAGDQGKVQSAWGTWTFGGDVMAYEFVGDSLYLFINYSDGLHLERMVLQEDAIRTITQFPINLDHQITLGSCSPTYDAGTGLTTITTPTYYDPATIAVVSAPASEDAGVQFELAHVAGNVFTTPGDITAETDAVIGSTYEYLWRLSTQYPREVKGSGTSIIQDGRLSLRYISFQYRDTSAFSVRITRSDGRSRQYDFEGRTLGASGNPLGSLSIETGQFRVPIMCRNEGVTIEVLNSTPYHCAFTAAEWQAQWRPRSAQRL